MGLFYKVPTKQLFRVRRDIFEKNGVPALKRNGFEESPYQGMRFGYLDPGTFAYDLCRLNARDHLEMITTYISRGDRWITVYLNIFELKPVLRSLEQLTDVDGIQFHLPPNSITKMRLRIDDFKGMPLFRTVDHKIKPFYTERGYRRRVEQLRQLIGNDLDNIDHFVNRWYELYRPMITNWQGKAIDKGAI